MNLEITRGSLAPLGVGSVTRSYWHSDFLALAWVWIWRQIWRLNNPRLALRRGIRRLTLRSVLHDLRLKNFLRLLFSSNLRLTGSWRLV